MSTVDQRNWAHGLVNAFRSRSANVVWFNVQRAQVANDLDARIDAPEKISQNDTLWCGYASILYTAARDQPQNYAWFIIGLFENGRGYLNFVRDGPAVPIEADESIRRGSLPRFLDNGGKLTAEMPQADYVALAALRDHFKTTSGDIAEEIPLLNLLNAVHGSSGGELCKALEKLGCKHTYDQSSYFSTRDMGFLNAAGGHFDQGHTVLLYIDSSLLDLSKAQAGHANHWVGLTSSVTYSPDRRNVKFDVFSWGKKYTVDTTVQVVQLRFFGFVTGY
ncbi:MAG TPA: hypothetical protein VGF59_02675 [Bryobacteraceae bacterium]|jgi:hypothetical protein